MQLLLKDIFGWHSLSDRVAFNNLELPLIVDQLLQKIDLNAEPIVFPMEGFEPPRPYIPMPTVFEDASQDFWWRWPMFGDLRDYPLWWTRSLAVDAQEKDAIRQASRRSPFKACRC